MNATPRNAPCPCGSGRRFKECHGKLAAEDDGVAARVRRSLAAHQAGRIDEARGGYEEILARAPGHAVATHYLGLADWQQGDPARAEERMRASIAADASVPDFHNNLGLLLRDTQRSDAAIASFRAALAANPAWIEAHNNLALAFESQGRWEDAIAAYGEAIAREPRFAAARQNLARVLLTLGRYREGWAEYRWRLLAQGLTAAMPSADAQVLPVDLAGRRFALVSEQGLGDVLFFLRFAPELKRRGAALAFRGDMRLHAMLSRTGLFSLGVERDAAPCAGMDQLFVGDLPLVLGIDDPARAPPSLALAPEPERVTRMRDALAALGPAPYVALTWRAGLEAMGPSRTQLKTVPVEKLGEALRGVRATWISVQRLPREGEREALGRAIGAEVHDLSACNESLDDMLALLSIVERYAGVSNANTYLRAATTPSFDVLVAHPPEWRWREAGGASPWFPGARLHREDARGDWSAALRTLRAAFT